MISRRSRDNFSRLLRERLALVPSRRIDANPRDCAEAHSLIQPETRGCRLQNRPLHSVLDARTSNGPMSLVLPTDFRSGVRVEASQHAPMSCRHQACSTAYRDPSGAKQMLQMNGSSDVVRVTTGSGPISVAGDKKVL